MRPQGIYRKASWVPWVPRRRVPPSKVADTGNFGVKVGGVVSGKPIYVKIGGVVTLKPVYYLVDQFGFGPGLGTSGGATNCTISHDTSEGNVALGSCKAITTGANGFYYYTISAAATPGQVWRASVRMKAPSGHINFQPVINFLNSGFGLVNQAVSTLTLSNGSWQELTMEGTALTGTAWAYVYPNGYDGFVARTCWTDDIKLHLLVS